MNREELLEMAQNELDRQKQFRCRLLVCASTPCISSGALAVEDALKKAVEAEGLRPRSKRSAPAVLARAAAALW